MFTCSHVCVLKLLATEQQQLRKFLITQVQLEWKHRKTVVRYYIFDSRTHHSHVHHFRLFRLSINLSWFTRTVHLTTRSFSGWIEMRKKSKAIGAVITRSRPTSVME